MAGQFVNISISWEGSDENHEVSIAGHKPVSLLVTNQSDSGEFSVNTALSVEDIGNSAIQVTITAFNQCQRRSVFRQFSISNLPCEGTGKYPYITLSSFTLKGLLKYMLVLPVFKMGFLWLPKIIWAILGLYTCTQYGNLFNHQDSAAFYFIAINVSNSLLTGQFTWLSDY